MSVPEHTLTAYRLGPGHAPRLQPAPALRAWMSATNDSFANRCLPLLIANQAGWMVLNPAPVRVEWNGGDRIEDLSVTSEAPRPLAMSHFGHGILTWHLPYLLRTPPEFDLLLRGPANWPKDGACALEGIVETSWSVATITMNWKLTRPGVVQFARDEPYCMLVPVRRGELDSFQPALRRLDDDPKISGSLRQWQDSRKHFLRELAEPDTEASRQLWQKHYFQGIAPDGTDAPAHTLKLRLRPFREE